MLFLVTLQKPIYFIFLKNAVNQILCFAKGDLTCEMVQCKRKRRPSHGSVRAEKITLPSYECFERPMHDCCMTGELEKIREQEKSYEALLNKDIEEVSMCTVGVERDSELQLLYKLPELLQPNFTL
jgi:hypothetical protein